MVISVKRKGKRRLLFVDLEFFGAEEGEEPETYHTHAAPRRCSTIRLLRHARNLHDAPRSVFRDKSIDRRSTCAHRERKTTIGSVVASMNGVHSNEESEARADPLSGSASRHARKSIGSEVDKLNKGSSRVHVASIVCAYLVQARGTHGVAIQTLSGRSSLVDRACSGFTRRSPTRTRGITSGDYLAAITSSIVGISATRRATVQPAS